uniref:EGF-like domain-containing protein n=1 Tax=Rhabditophanes sp. KR3021 TaxID=114890 RepID=A0AC35UFT7_9BILA
MNILLLGVLISSTLVSANIRLLSPPSLNAEYDFTQTFSQTQKCHDVNEKDTKAENLYSDKAFNLTWLDLAKLSGQYTLEVLNFDDQKLKYSSPLKNVQPQSDTDSYVLTTSVTFPSSFEECEKCYLRILSTTENRNLSSCSLVSIKKAFEKSDESFKVITDECESNSDCRNEGRCSNDGKCFCKHGFIGKTCDEQVDVELFKQSFKSENYEVKDFIEGGNKLYWKIDGLDINFVVKFPVNSWLLTGIRPVKYQDSCPSMRFIQPQISTHNVETNRNESSNCAINEVFYNCPEKTRECEASCDWTADPENIPTCSKGCAETPRCICQDGYVRAGNNNNTCVPFNHCQQEEVDVHSSPKNEVNVELHCPVNETINACGKACEADCSTVFVRDKCSDCSTQECSCNQGYARLNGKCVYWQDCDLSSEQLAASSTGSPITTTITPISTHEDSFPARAQAIKTQLSSNNDEKSHVKSLSKFNKIKTEELDTEAEIFGDLCFGEMRHPAGCLSGECEYRLSWNLDEINDKIEFSLETKLPSTNYWTGVAFSKNGAMNDSDIIAIRSTNNKLSIADMHSGKHNAPELDIDQNIENFKGQYTNGLLKAEFSRARKTLFGNKNEDAQFDDDNCYHFIFPVTGKRLSGDKITGYPTNPIISQRQICIKKCKECINNFRHPEGCESEDCEYSASWSVEQETGEVEFEISSKGMGRWTGIGFSETPDMTNADMILGWVYDGKPYIQDRFSYNKQVPVIDSIQNQDIFSKEGKIEDDIQTITFRRKIVTDDKTTDYSLDKCLYFLYPVSGGRVLAKSGDDFKNDKTAIAIHDSTPKVSSQKICICGANTDEAPRFKRQTPDPFNASVKSNNADLPNMPKPQPTFEDPLRCSDVVVIASNEKGETNIRDYYALSSSFVRPDEYFGGSQSLTKVISYLEDNIVTVAFTRKLDPRDFTDQSILSKGNKDMTVLFAQGQLPNATDVEHLNLNSLVSKGGAEGFDTKLYVFTKNLYNTPTNQIPSEGSPFKDVANTDDETFTKTGSVVSVTSSKDVSSKDVNDCNHFMNYPPNFHNGTIKFELKAKAPVLNHWTGVGFSTTGTMAGTDLIAVSVLGDSTVTITDQFVPDYSKPVLDSDQSIFNVSGKYVDGFIHAKFSRGLESSDPNDVNLENPHCIFFVFPTSGGEILGGELEIHNEIPIVSEKKICIHKCGNAAVTEKPFNNAEPVIIPESVNIFETTTQSEIKQEATTQSENTQETTSTQTTQQTTPSQPAQETTQSIQETTQSIQDTTESSTEVKQEVTTVTIEATTEETQTTTVHHEKTMATTQSTDEDNVEFTNIDFNIPQTTSTPQVISESTTEKVVATEEITTEATTTKEIVTEQPTTVKEATTNEQTTTEEQTTESPSKEVNVVVQENTVEHVPTVESTPDSENIDPKSSSTSKPTEKIETDDEDTIGRNIITTIQKIGMDTEEDENDPNDGYTLILRILNRKWDDELSSEYKDAHKNMTTDVKDTVNIILKDRFPTLEFDKVLKYRKGSVLAYVHLKDKVLTDEQKNELPEDQRNAPSLTDLSDHIKEVSILGTIGKLDIDPEAIRAYSSEGNSLNHVLLRNWEIIGLVIVGILMIACLLCCLCFCCCKKKKKATKKNEVAPYNPYGYNEYENKAYKASLNNVSASYTVNPIYAQTPASMAGTMKRSEIPSSVPLSPSSNRYQIALINSTERHSNIEIEGAPDGLGETTYQEWQRDVASKETPTHIQESSGYTPAITSSIQRQPSRSGNPMYGQPPGYYYKPY